MVPVALPSAAMSPMTPPLSSTIGTSDNPAGNSLSVETAAASSPSGLVDARPGPALLGVVTPALQERLRAPATQGTLKLTPINSGAGDQSLTKPRAASQQPKKTVPPKPKKVVKKTPAKSARARAERALTLGEAVVMPPPRTPSGTSAAKPTGNRSGPAVPPPRATSAAGAPAAAARQTAVTMKDLR